MSTRSTPFATFASCAVGEVRDKNNLCLGNKISKNFRLDMLYLCSLAQKIQAEKNLRHYFSYQINHTVYFVGNKIRFISYEYGNTGRIYKIEEVPQSKILNLIIKHIQTYIPFAEIERLLLSNFNIKEEDAIGYINMLIDNQILVSEISPFIIGPDYFKYLIDKLSKIEMPNIYMKRLLKIQEKLTVLNSVDNVNIAKLYNEIENIIQEIQVPYNKKYILQVDSIRCLNQNSLSASIPLQISEYIEFVLSLNSVLYHSKNMINFKQKFKDRYELQEIPLLEALDPDIGIGYGLSAPKTDTSLINNLILPKQSRGQINRGLSNFTLKMLLENNKHQKEINIERLISQKKGVKLIKQELPYSISAMFSLVQNEEEGNCLITNLHLSGSGAGNLIARFAYCDKRIESLLYEIAEEEKHIEKDFILAEISHIPNERVGNVLTRPFIRDYEISYISNSVRNRKQIISPNDVLISIKHDTIFLRSKKLNKYIIPRLTNAHNYHNNPSSVYLFLCELQNQNKKVNLNFSWEELEGRLSFYPRIRFKNIILHLARWVFHRNETKYLFYKYEYQKIKEWVRINDIPELATLVEGDNKLFIDFRNEVSTKIFFNEVKEKNSFIIEEFISCGKASMNQLNQNFMNEIIIPFILK